jgi:hypothetical protein
MRNPGSERHFSAAYREYVCDQRFLPSPPGEFARTGILRFMNVSRVAAIHEAGHAVAAVRAGLVFDRVSAMPDEERELDGALYWLELHEQVELAMPPELLAMVLLAGPCAEARLRRLRIDRLFAGVAATDDRAALASLGLSDAQFVTASRDALALVDRDWAAIEHVAQQLETGRALAFDEVGALVAASDAISPQ